MAFSSLPGPRKAASPNKLIHDLVEQSRNRMAHVRAGQSLFKVLDTQPAIADGSTRPSPVVTTLVRDSGALPALRHNTSTASGPRATVRKHAGVVLPPANPPLAPLPPSYEQYAVYAGSNLAQSESVNMLNRRKAVTTDFSHLKKLVAIVSEQTHASGTTAAKLKRAVAVMKSKNAFLSLKRHSPRSVEVKNAHMAFLEFKAAGEAKAPSNMARINAPTHEPIRFGDAVCLLSLVSNLPLAIGRNGRSMAVTDAVTGPHMVFTVVDFRNPSRQDDVLEGDDFWLRVDASQLDVGGEDEILALLMDTHYYLGGPGAIEDDSELAPKPHSRGAKYAKEDTKTRDRAAFKLVAMKASVPSIEYYGDDRATREYAMETNASVLRLAKWQFVPAKKRPARDESDNETNVTSGGQLVLNCSSVGLVQGDFALEYDAVRGRAVLRGVLGRFPHGPETHTALVNQKREAGAWQIRLMHRNLVVREHEASKDQASKLASPQKQDRPSEQETLEWLQFHRDKVEREAARIESKHALARDAHRAYDKVAALSNAKLLQIERGKALNHREYFQSRFQTTFESRPSKVRHGVQAENATLTRL